MNGTVKQFLKALDEMRDIYHFDDEKTEICTISHISMSNNTLSICTKDEKTGVIVELTKVVTREE